MKHYRIFLSCLLIVSLVVSCAFSSLAMGVVPSKEVVDDVFDTEYLHDDNALSAEPIVEKADEILQEYYNENNRLKSTNDLSRQVVNSDMLAEKIELQTQTVEKLNNAGYKAYSVTVENFASIQAELETDFGELGLQETGNYIIMVSGEEDKNGSSRATESGWYYYSYNDSIYKMRRLTITAADEPSFAKADQVDLLDTGLGNFIVNCLDAVIGMGLDVLQPGLGTVASILGLSVEMIEPTPSEVFSYIGSANWTREYTQVWHEAENKWKNGACVEKVYAIGEVNGHYYNKQTNQMTYIDNEIDINTYYSDAYFNSNLSNQEAAKNYGKNKVTAWAVPDVYYIFNGSAVMHFSNTSDYFVD